jgi:hypothetical protein
MSEYGSMARGERRGRVASRRTRARAELHLGPAVRTLFHIVATIWILINVYVWGVMSAPSSLTGRLPDAWLSDHARHRAVLTRVFYRPYVWWP